MSKIEHITEETISKITTSLAQVSPLFNELLPSFTTRYSEKLGNCLGCACEEEDPIKRISTVYAMINKERPFPTGNKRIALALLLYLLAQDGKWLKASADELYAFAHWVSTAPADAEEDVINYVEKFIKKHEVMIEGKKQK